MKQELYKDIPTVIIDKNDLPKCIKISITIDEKLWNEFRDFCDMNGLKYSTRIGILINKDIRKNNQF